MLIFLDLETTGLQSDDKICSIAYIAVEEEDVHYDYRLLNEGKKIAPKASSVHHITNEMIQDKKSFKESEIFTFLQKHNHKNTILIAHNSQFHREKLASSGVVWQGEILDTLKVTKHLIPECEFFSLQFLRYELKLYKEEEALSQQYGIKDALVAHNALSDVIVTQLLYKYLQSIVETQEMLELSAKNVLLEKFSFGKHKGRYIEDVCFNDNSYIQWLLKNATDMDEDLIYSINYHLQG